MARALSVTLAALAFASSASAQPRPYRPPPVRPLELAPMVPPAVGQGRARPTTALRAHFGMDLVARLARSDDADERLEGMEMAASDGSPAGLAVLVRALESTGAARLDARALVAVARGLAAYAGHSEARGALQGIVNAPPIPSHALTRADGSPTATPERGARFVEDVDDSLEQGRIDLARGTAAVALASSGDPHATDTIAAIARGGGGGQDFAARALGSFPLSQTGMGGSFGALSPTMIRYLAAVSDIRSLDVIRGAARTGDGPTRAAAFTALGEMGDSRGAPLAQAALKDSSPQVRAAATRALVLLGAPERLRAVEALLSDDATAEAGAEIAEMESDDGVVKALAARVAVSARPALRRAIVAALGRAEQPSAILVLSDLTSDPILGGDAAAAIARSPSPAAAPAILTLLRSAAGSATRRLGARAFVVRAIVRGQADSEAMAQVKALARGADPLDRAVGLGALVALEEIDVDAPLEDPDAQVRRAVAVAAHARRGSKSAARALLARLAREPDPATRIALSAGLAEGDPDTQVTTLALIDRAESGGPDAPLAALAFARRAEGSRTAKVDALLAAADPLVRAHVARGLARSRARDTIGKLALAYAYEPEVSVRRAIVLAMAARTQDAASPSRLGTLALAARLDPDRAIRAAAARAMAGFPSAPGRAETREVAWLRLASPEGAAPAFASAAVSTGSLVEDDGLAVPIAFDADGYALVAVPPGEARLVLAPRLPAYESARP